MHSKIKLKNQFVMSPPKTRRKMANESSNLGKENIAEVSTEAIVNKRRRVATKPLQEKNNTVEDTRKGKEKESCESITISETKPTISHVMTRNMKRRTKSEHSMNRILSNRNACTQQNEISLPKPERTTNITSMKENSFVQTRKMAALEGCRSQKPIPHILTSSNRTTNKGAEKGIIGQRKSRKERATRNNSTELSYENKLNDNQNTTAYNVFDFESNSQEIADTSDDPMKDVIKKLVRENKAVVKHKAARKKGVTGVTEKVTTLKLPHSELKKNYFKKLLSNIIEVKKPRKKATPKAIVKIAATASHRNMGQFVKSQGLTHESTDIEKSLKRTQMQGENLDLEDMSEIGDSENWGEIQNSGDVASIVDSEDESMSSLNEPLTPPKPILNTYKIPKSMTPQCQSTPVLQATHSLASPWRASDDELLTSLSTDLHFSKFDMVNMKGNERKSIEQKSVASQQIVSDDVKNCFGFNSDDSDDNGDNDSLPNVNFSIIETVKKRHRANKPISDDSEIAQPTPKVFQDFRNPTAKQTTTKKQVKVPKKKKVSKRNVVRKLLFHHQPENITQERSFVNAESSYDVPVLFETNWPTREENNHRSYTRILQQKCNSIVSDDTREAENETFQRCHRKKKKDLEFEEKLRKFEEEFNASCREVENFDLIVEVE